MAQFHFAHNPPVASDVELLSSKLAVTLPLDYVKFLLTVNGGSPDAPCFVYTDKRGKPKSGVLHWLYGITKDQGDSRSLERVNGSFLEMDATLKGAYVIIGYTDVGHLLLDCSNGYMVVQNLNHSYGIPEGGFDKHIMKSVASFIESLTPDPKGKWKPLRPFGLG
jgi:hypothetical protein